MAAARSVFRLSPIQRFVSDTLYTGSHIKTGAGGSQVSIHLINGNEMVTFTYTKTQYLHPHKDSVWELASVIHQR